MRSVRAGRRVMASTRSFLERRMRLKVNEERRSARTSRGAFSGVPLSMPADGGGTVRARTPSVCPIVAGVVPGSRSTRTSNPLWGQQPRQSSKESSKENDSLEFSPETSETSARLRCSQKERNISRCWYVAAQQTATCRSVRCSNSRQWCCRQALPNRRSFKRKCQVCRTDTRNRRWLQCDRTMLSQSSQC